MWAIHIKCEPEGIGLKGMTQIGGGLYRSEAWPFTEGEANLLLARAPEGGWVYFHPTKAETSVFGGVCLRVEKVQVEDAAIEDRVVFEFRARHEGRGNAWRGQDHMRAWTGGIIEPTLPHEQREDDAQRP
jgi:hypothetical protein